MRKTTAKVQYEDYAHQGKFCNVNFYGFRAEEMQEKWSETKVKRCKYLTFIYEGNEQESKRMRRKAKAIYNQIAKSKPFYRWWYNQAEKAMINEADKLIKEAYQLKEKNKEIAEKLSVDNNEACTEIKEFLQDNGFVSTGVSFIGDECITNIECWILEEEE